MMRERTTETNIRQPADKFARQRISRNLAKGATERRRFSVKVVTAPPAVGHSSEYLMRSLLVAGTLLALALPVAAQAHNGDGDDWWNHRHGSGWNDDRWDNDHDHDRRPWWRRDRDRDDNPPGPRGGPGTNWENPPGWRGGPGTSPDHRTWRFHPRWGWGLWD